MPTVEEILGSDAAGLLQHQCKTIAKESLHLPGPDYIERVHLNSNRPIPVLTKLQSLFDHGRLGGSGARWGRCDCRPAARHRGEDGGGERREGKAHGSSAAVRV